MDDYYCGDDLTFGKKTKEKRKKKKRKISKKKEKGKKSSPPKIHHHHLLVRTHHHERGTRTRSLLLSLERVARSLFLGFSTRGNAPFFSLFFFARDTHRTLSRERKGGGGSITRAKRTKKTTIIASKCVLARKIIAPTGPRATRLGDSTRAKRAERMRSNPFLSRSVSTVVAKWVGAGVRRSVVVVKRR